MDNPVSFYLTHNDVVLAYRPTIEAARAAAAVELRYVPVVQIWSCDGNLVDTVRA